MLDSAQSERKIVFWYLKQNQVDGFLQSVMVQCVLCFSETLKGQKTALTFRTIELTKHKSITTTNRSGMNTSFQSKFNSNRPCHLKKKNLYITISLFIFFIYFQMRKLWLCLKSMSVIQKPMLEKVHWRYEIHCTLCNISHFFTIHQTQRILNKKKASLFPYTFQNCLLSSK